MITTYNQAKRLELLGYNEISHSGYIGYTKGGELVSRRQYAEDKEYQIIPCWIKSPRVSEALQWIRENKKDVLFRIDCFYSPMLKNVAYQGIRLNRNALIIKSRTNEYLTYPEAESALLDELLTYLEQKR